MSNTKKILIENEDGYDKVKIDIEPGSIDSNSIYVVVELENSEVYEGELPLATVPKQPSKVTESDLKEEDCDHCSYCIKMESRTCCICGQRV